MKRLGAAVAAVVVVATFLNTPADAAVRPTVSGPGTVPYFAAVTLRGSTPEPNQRVVIYTKGPVASRFSRFRTVTSDAHGRFAVTYRPTHVTRYYARAGGVDSSVHTTHLVTADCTSSRAVLKPLPGVPGPWSGRGLYRFAALTATRHGLWAGYVASGDYFAVVTLRRGHKPVVLDRFFYNGTPLYPNYYGGNVVIAGITPRGTVVATVERPKDGTRIGLAWPNGKRHKLSAAHTWRALNLVGISDSGKIIGRATVGSERNPRTYMVTWAGVFAHYHVVRDATGRPRPGPDAVDGLGDMAFGTRVRLAGGGIARLGVVDQNTTIALRGAGKYLFGEDDGLLLRWNMAAAAPGDVIRPKLLAPRRADNTAITAASRRGDVVTAFRPPGRLRTAAGAYLPMPSSEQPYVGGNAIDGDGRTAYTAPGGFVHFLRCR